MCICSPSLFGVVFLLQIVKMHFSRYIYFTFSIIFSHCKIAVVLFQIHLTLDLGLGAYSNSGPVSLDRLGLLG